MNNYLQLQSQLGLKIRSKSNLNVWSPLTNRATITCCLSVSNFRAYSLLSRRCRTVGRSFKFTMKVDRARIRYIQMQNQWKWGKKWTLYWSYFSPYERKIIFFFDKSLYGILVQLLREVAHSHTNIQTNIVLNSRHVSTTADLAIACTY